MVCSSPYGQGSDFITLLTDFSFQFCHVQVWDTFSSASECTQEGS